jgi:hypothetical protein
MAKEGNKQACVILAKQLLQLRKQETRTVAASSKITGIKTHTQVGQTFTWFFFSNHMNVNILIKINI